MAVTEDRYQKVRVKMWRGDTVPNLSREGKLLWVYLLTSPDTTMIPGIFSVGIGSIADDLGYTADEVRAALSEITATGEVEFDPAGLVWFRKALDHNPPDAPNNVKGWRRHWSEIKKCALKDVAWAEIRSWLGENRGQTFVQAFDLACPRPTNSKNPQNRTTSPTPSPTGYATPSGTPYRTQKQYQEQKQEQNTPPPPLGGKAREGAPVCVREDSTPPEPTSAHEPPPSAKTAPCAIRDDEDDPTGPMTSRGASLPPPRATAPDPQPAPSPASEATTPTTPEPPVVVLAPEPCPAPPPVSPVVVPAPVEPETPRPPSAPAEAPAPATSGQLALVDDDAPDPTAVLTARPDVRQVFDHWAAHVWPNKTIAPKATKDRLKRIKARLTEGYTVPDLCLALDGVQHDPWLMGTKDGSRPGGFRDIDAVLRDGPQVERLMALAQKHAPPPAPPPVPRAPPRPAVAAFIAANPLPKMPSQAHEDIRNEILIAEWRHPSLDEIEQVLATRRPAPPSPRPGLTVGVA